MKSVPRPAAILSVVALACAAAASLATLAWPGAFPDSTPPTAVNEVLAEARGWSAATLLVAIPLAQVSLLAAEHGSMRGRLLWVGSLAYFVYTYLELAVSPPFTALYLLYVLVFGCAIPALVMGAWSIDLDELQRSACRRPPRRTVAAFSILVAVVLTIAWLKGILAQTLAGTFGWPVGLDAVGHVVHALDLGLQVPLGIAAGALLLRRQTAGNLVGAVMLANGVCMMAALTAMVGWSKVASGASVWGAWPFALVWCVAVGLSVAFFRAFPNARRSRRAPSPRNEPAEQH